MLVSEFIKRTGYNPTPEEYDEIEQAYNVFNGDKDAYCRAWSRANPHKAGRIWKEQKKQAHKDRVLKLLCNHISRHAQRENWWYYMDYAQQQAHIDYVQECVQAKSRNELREAIFTLTTSYALRQNWSDRSYRYFYDLQKFA